MASCTHSPSELVAGTSVSIAQLQGSLDARAGPAQYGQLQAVMALRGLVPDRSPSSGTASERGAAPDFALPGPEGAVSPTGDAANAGLAKEA
mmetsp:Transcript_83089/g.185469  ORF Transcript_83089/g.185469 Transcript_83089/m.185469 type:complete len:92 (-) Transcript_83089:125-400(-)